MTSRADGRDAEGVAVRPCSNHLVGSDDTGAAGFVENLDRHAQLLLKIGEHGGDKGCRGISGWSPGNDNLNGFSRPRGGVGLMCSGKKQTCAGAEGHERFTKHGKADMESSFVGTGWVISSLEMQGPGENSAGFLSRLALAF